MVTAPWEDRVSVDPFTTAGGSESTYGLADLETKSMRTARWALLVLLCCFLACRDTKGFDKLCGFYATLAVRPGVEGLSDQQRYETIRQRVDSELDPKELARRAWEAAVPAQRGQRYQMFEMDGGLRVAPSVRVRTDAGNCFSKRSNEARSLYRLANHSMTAGHAGMGCGSF